MKKILIVLAGMLALVACGGSPSTELLRQAFDVVESRPDSTLVILEKMDVASLTEEERAEYGLLMTMADHKTHQKDRLSDSLISSSISYFDQNGNQRYRASAYYYRGCVRYYQKRNVEAIHDYKTAEALAEPLDDELLRNKIYEMLAYANYSINNKPEILRYSLKLLDSSQKMRDSMMLARSYSMVATGYSNIGKKDSAYVNVIKSLDYIDAVDPKTQSDLLFNVATYYNETGHAVKAEQCITERVLKNANDKRGYLTMARIRKQQGKTNEAIDYATQVLETNDHKMYRKALDLLAELYSEQGDSSQAYAMKKRSDEFTDSLEKANKTAETALWQQKFDEQQMKEASDRKSRWLLWGVVLTVAVVAIGWWWHRKKMRTFSSIIDANVRQIAAQKQEIARIEATGTQNSRQIEELKRQVAEQQEQLSARLHVGTKLYDRLRQGENISEATGKDLQCLVEFYALLRPMQWYRWEQRYHALTPKQVAFLILQDEMRSSDNQIAHALGISESTVRVVRSRIRGREK